MKLKVYKTKHYYGLQKEEQTRNKIGYISFNGWLNVSEELKELLKDTIKNSAWEDGNSHGGSKEKHKLKFGSADDAFKKLREANFELVFLDNKH